MGTRLLDHPTAIDPRIRARRIEVARNAARRRGRRLVEVGLVLVVAAGFAVAVRSPLLAVDEIRIAGADRTGTEAVARATGIRPGDLLVDLDPGRAAERVAALPWVERVSLHRRIDGTVSVEVVERRPAAVAQAADDPLVVDVAGHVLAPLGEVPDATGLVTVTGVSADLAVGDRLPDETLAAVELASRLAEAGLVAVTEVRAGEELVALLEGGGAVRVGGLDRLDAKIVALATVLEQVDLACLATLDLRLPGNPVLTREDACS